MFVLLDTQKVVVNIDAKNAVGNTAPVENAVVTSSDTSIVTVSQDANGNWVAESTGVLGSAQIVVEADADLGEGVKLITATDTIEVRASEAVIIGLKFGEATDK